MDAPAAQEGSVEFLPSLPLAAEDGMPLRTRKRGRAGRWDYVIDERAATLSCGDRCGAVTCAGTRTCRLLLHLSAGGNIAAFDPEADVAMP